MLKVSLDTAGMDIDKTAMKSLSLVKGMKSFI